jgi:hypothetical protein
VQQPAEARDAYGRQRQAQGELWHGWSSSSDGGVDRGESTEGKARTISNFYLVTNDGASHFVEKNDNVHSFNGAVLNGK